MKKFVVAAFAVCVQTTLAPSALGAGPLMIATPPDVAPLPDRAAQCPARVPGKAAFSLAGPSGMRPRVAARPDPFNEALASLYRGLADEDPEPLKAARAYFLRNKANSMLAGIASTQLALLLNDQTILQDARMLTEKSLALLRPYSDPASSQNYDATAALIKVKLLQANAIGGKAGVDLIREAIDENDQLIKKFASNTKPELVKLRRRSWLEVSNRLPYEVLTEAALLQAIQDFEYTIPDDNNSLEQFENRSVLAQALVRLTEHQTGQDSLTAARRARTIIAELIDQAKALSGQWAQRERLDVLGGNLSGTWRINYADQSDPCVIDAQLQSLLARADLVLAADDAGVREARQRLLDADGGTVRNSVCGRAVEHYAAMALIKRSPKRTANWALAMVHSRGGIFHSFSERFKIR